MEWTALDCTGPVPYEPTSWLRRPRGLCRRGGNDNHIYPGALIDNHLPRQSPFVAGSVTVWSRPYVGVTTPTIYSTWSGYWLEI